jgi:hypothetical protein
MQQPHLTGWAGVYQSQSFSDFYLKVRSVTRQIFREFDWGRWASPRYEFPS